MKLSLVPTVGALFLAAFVLACGQADAAKSPGTTASSAASKATASTDTLADSVLMSRADQGRYEGSPTAPIWIVMISDFQCPYCKEWHDSTLAKVRSTYVETGKARLAYLNLPLQNHRHSMVMAKAGLCAAAQQRFWPYIDAMFSKQSAVAGLGTVEPLLVSLADNLKLDTVAFNHCQKSNAIAQLVQSDLRQVNSARIQSTPSFFVGQFILEGAVPFPSFKKAVDSALVIASKKAGAE